MNQKKKRNRKQYIFFIVLLSFVVLGISIFISSRTRDKEESGNPVQYTNENQAETSPQATAKNADNESVVKALVNKNGNCLATRINAPEGYERVLASKNSFVSFMRELTLKPDQSKVLLYDGSEKGNQSAQIAVFNFDVGDRDLQQCADSIIRVYAEYYWKTKNYDKIAFHLTNGFLMEYSKWQQGYRLVVDGNDVKWSKKSSEKDSYESFRAYLTSVYTYAGTLSLSTEGSAVELLDIKVGDMFIYGASPGHCVLVVDMAVNALGEKCFLLAQGYMPAQDFHVLRNPAHEEDPWYYVSELGFPIRTPQWSFEEGSLMRWADFE